MKDELVFVCTGNTCRSPMAEGLFRAHDGEKRTGLHASSAGLYTMDGLPASENARQAAGALGADLSGHHSRRLTPEIVENARYLVCMTAAHYDQAAAMFPKAQDKVFLLADRDIADPFGGDLAVYQACAAQLDQAVEQLIERLEGAK